jgi:1-phosphatidylinositol-4-phosphate 5-kinase
MKFLFVVFSTLIYKSIGTAWEAPYCTDETSNFSMDLIDRYLLLIFAPIAFLCTVFITSTFLFFPKTRRMPGDIIFCISLCECILSMHWFISALYDVQHDEAPD